MNELMSKVITTIQISPENWNQGSWVTASSHCGTTMCVAGWAAVLSGECLLREVKNGDGKIVASEIVYADSHEVVDEDDFIYIGERLLDLDHDQAYAIFQQTNIGDPQQMERHIKMVLANKHEHDTVQPCSC